MTRDRLPGMLGSVAVVAAISAIVVLVCAPLWQATLPATDDGVNHLQRLVAFDDRIRQGDLYPRWYPAFATGYGYPIGNFAPPLALYVAELPLLLGFDAAAGIRFAFTLASALAISGAFLLGQSVAGRAGGLLCAVAYGAAPYLIGTTAIRGALPEALALGLAPWSIWAIGRWQGQRRGLVLTAAGLGLVLLAHPIVALCCWPLAAGWHVLQRRAWRTTALPFALALGLTAFWWLPYVTESPAVAIDNFRDATMGQLVGLAAAVQFAPIYAYGDFPLRIGAVLAIAAIGGAVAYRRLAVPLAAAALLAMGASTLSGPLWQGISALDAVQFPWRLFGPASLCLAFAAAGLGRWPIVAACSAGVLLVSGLAARPESTLTFNPATLSVGGVVRREVTDGTIGTTTSAEFLPATARAAYTPNNLPTATGGPSPLAVQVSAFSANAFRLSVSNLTAAPAELSIHAFAFPGWQARIDGLAVPVTPSGPLGTAGILIAPGDHLVELWFGDTAARVVGWAGAAASLALSAFLLSPRFGFVAALAISLVAGWYGTDQPRGMASVTLEAATIDGIAFAGGSARTGDGGEVVVDAVWIGNGDGRDGSVGVRLRSENGQVTEAFGAPVWATSSPRVWRGGEVVVDSRRLRVAGGTYEVVAVVDGQERRVGQVKVAPSDWIAEPPGDARFGPVSLTRWLIDGQTADGDLPLGGQLTVRTGWTATAAIPTNFTIFAQVVDSTGAIVAQQDGQPNAGFDPMTLWATGELHIDQRTITVPAALEPGAYQLIVGLYDLKTLERPRLAGGGTSLALLPLKVRGPQSLPAGLTRVDSRFGDIAQLIGYRVDPDGSVLLAWRAIGDTRPDRTMFVHRVDERGVIITQQDGEPLGGRYPFSRWSNGEIVTDRVMIKDQGSLRIGLYDPATGRREIVNGRDAIDLE